MKTAAWGAFMVSVAALAVGCGSGGSSTPGAGGAGGGEMTSTTTTSTGSKSGSTGTMTTVSTTVSTSTASGVTTTSSGMMSCGTFKVSDDALCQSCMTEQCCTELTDCGPECSALFDCFNQCAASDKACLQKCVNDHPTGLNPFNALATCFQNSCEKDKRCTGFPICDSGLFYPASNPALEACANCLGTNCCAEFTACAHDTDKTCLDCLNNPMGAGCSMDTEANAAVTCITSKCSMECK